MTTTATLAAEAQAKLELLAGPDAILRPDQLEAIEALVANRRHVLVVQRTGWGKSAVYWIAAQLLRERGEGPTLVVSPLLALMRDQVSAATRMGLAAQTVNSSNIESWSEIFSDLSSGAIDVLLISPERLNNHEFRRTVLPQLASSLGMLVIDEAHCISDWGHDFRPDYRRLASVIAELGDSVPVLATTATANERVSVDIAQQIGTDTLTLRGTLDRESLALAVVHLDTAAERMAWLAEELEATTGSGIVYCLTVAEAERVAGYLAQEGISAESYTGATEVGRREHIESLLANNEVRCVVATSALGMGYDKGDLAFVIHLGSPSSPISYYQQVGRAGRAIDSARATLLPSATDIDIWRYFDSTAFPAQEVVESVLAALAESACSIGDLEVAVNLRRGRLEALLKVLDVEGVVERVGNNWQRTSADYRYDRERIEGVAAARSSEQAAMVEYSNLTSCRMKFLREQLDDPGAVDCGRCDVCTGISRARELPSARIAGAQQQLRSSEFIIEPRKQWARGMDQRKGNIAPGSRAEVGRALAYATDPGWSTPAAKACTGPDGPISDELFEGVVSVLKRWKWSTRPTWVCPMPSRTHPQLIGSLCDRLAIVGKLQLVEALELADLNAPRQASLNNSVRQATNAVELFRISEAYPNCEFPSGPCLLVDDTMQSGWTMTAATELLRGAGATAVLPLVVWRRP